MFKSVSDQVQYHEERALAEECQALRANSEQAAGAHATLAGMHRARLGLLDFIEDLPTRPGRRPVHIDRTDKEG